MKRILKLMVSFGILLLSSVAPITFVDSDPEIKERLFESYNEEVGSIIKHKSALKENHLRELGY